MKMYFVWLTFVVFALGTLSGRAEPEARAGTVLGLIESISGEAWLKRGRAESTLNITNLYKEVFDEDQIRCSPNSTVVIGLYGGRMKETYQGTNWVKVPTRRPPSDSLSQAALVDFILPARVPAKTGIYEPANESHVRLSTFRGFFWIPKSASKEVTLTLKTQKTGEDIWSQRGAGYQEGQFESDDLFNALVAYIQEPKGPLELRLSGLSDLSESVAITFSVLSEDEDKKVFEQLRRADEQYSGVTQRLVRAYILKQSKLFNEATFEYEQALAIPGAAMSAHLLGRTVAEHEAIGNIRLAQEYRKQLMKLLKRDAG